MKAGQPSYSTNWRLGRKSRFICHMTFMCSSAHPGCQTSSRRCHPQHTPQSIPAVPASSWPGWSSHRRWGTLLPRSASRPEGWWCPESTQTDSQGDNNRGKAGQWATNLTVTVKASVDQGTVLSFGKGKRERFKMSWPIMIFLQHSIILYHSLFWSHFTTMHSVLTEWCFVNNADGNIPFSDLRLFTDTTNCWASFGRRNPKSVMLGFFPLSNQDCYVD